jgi:hypothetical protein
VAVHAFTLCTIRSDSGSTEASYPFIWELQIHVLSCTPPKVVFKIQTKGNEKKL